MVYKVRPLSRLELLPSCVTVRGSEKRWHLPSEVMTTPYEQQRNKHDTCVSECEGVSVLSRSLHTLHW